jgi:acyl-coenzyme A thioesterase PaaI-like protein
MSRIEQGWLARVTLRAGVLRFVMNLWPPFRGARIRVEALADDFRYARIAIPLRLANRNMWGVHFGGSLFAMTDGLYGIMLKQNLGRDYAVWDKSAQIDFVKPGRGRVYAEFRIDEALLERIREATREGEKTLPRFHVQVFDESGDVVADVHKVMYVRKLRPTAPLESLP